MRLVSLAVLLALGVSPVRAAEQCGNALFNIVRANECLAYTEDRQRINDLRDKRIDAISDWIEHNPGGGATLDLMLKEGERRMAQAMARDRAVFPDDQMYKMRGCRELPVCVHELQEAMTPRPKPTPKPVVRNTRTGGKWCGPRDRAAGYCNWKGWLK